MGLHCVLAEDYRLKNRYSLYFGEDALAGFEIAPEGVEGLPRSCPMGRPEQLRLPFQDTH